MTATTTVEARTPDAVLGQLVSEPAGSVGVLLTALGTRTGLWTALAGAGPRTPSELAADTALAEPVVREWCRAQAAGGYLTYRPQDAAFTLPVEVQAALLDGPGTALVDACVEMTASLGAGFDEFVAAVRAGRGFGWHRRDDRF